MGTPRPAGSRRQRSTCSRPACAAPPLAPRPPGPCAPSPHPWPLGCLLRPGCSRRRPAAGHRPTGRFAAPHRAMCRSFHFRKCFGRSRLQMWSRSSSLLISSPWLCALMVAYIQYQSSLEPAGSRGRVPVVTGACRQPRRAPPCQPPWHGCRLRSGGGGGCAAAGAGTVPGGAGSARLQPPTSRAEVDLLGGLQLLDPRAGGLVRASNVMLQRAGRAMGPGSGEGGLRPEATAAGAGACTAAAAQHQQRPRSLTSPPPFCNCAAPAASGPWACAASFPATCS